MSVKEDELYEIEKVLKTRRLRGGVVEKFVKWKGYPDKFSSWVKDITVMHGQPGEQSRK